MSRLNGQGEHRLPAPLWDNRPARPCPCHSGPDPDNRFGIESRERDREARGEGGHRRYDRHHAHHTERVSTHCFSEAHRHSPVGGKRGWVIGHPFVVGERWKSRYTVRHLVRSAIHERLHGGGVRESGSISDRLPIRLPSAIEEFNSLF